MKKRFWAYLLIISLLLAAPACAEIYRYIDANGQQRWTDDLSQVPKEQRQSAQRIQSIDTRPADVQAKPESPLQSEPGNQGADDQKQSADLSRNALEKEKADLDTQYQQLLQERKQLDQMKTEAKTREDQLALKDRISGYNSKTQQYETQLNAFNKKIQAYNQKIMAKQPSHHSE